MFRFESSQYFNLLWILPIVLLLSWGMKRRLQTKMQGALGSRAFEFLSTSVSTKKRRLKLVLQLICVVFMVLALARPQFGQSQQKVKSEGVELMLAVDVSESMLAEDVKPNRLEQAKAELNKLVDLMPGNKMGVIAFAGSAVLMSPMTNDPNAVKMYIDSLQTNSVSTQGTSFQEMLEAAKEAFERGGVGSEEAEVKATRVLLVLSDGEDHEPGALEFAKENLFKVGIRVFSVAYGTESGGTIPVRDGMGFLKGYKKDDSGQVITTAVKGEALRALAEAGQGAFYFSTFGGNHIRQLVSDIGKLEKAEFENSMVTQYDEKFQWPLVFAIVVGILELLMGERRSSFRFWKGRFEVPAA